MLATGAGAGDVNDGGVLYRSASLVVRDIHCALHHERPGPEEYSEDHTIVLVRSGLFTRTVGGATQVADPNHVLFFTRHDPYHVTHPVAGGDTCTSLSLRTADLLDVVRSYAPADAERDTAPFAFAWALSSPRTVLLHHSLITGLRRADIAAFAVEDLVFELVDDLVGRAHELFRHGDRRRRPRSSRHQRSIVEAAKLMIGRHVQAPPALREMAEVLGCSPFHLCRMFHRESGLPMRRYLDRCRLRTAVERLADGEKDLTGLALDLGYADHSHFSNAFRCEFGMSPSHVRRRLARTILTGNRTRGVAGPTGSVRGL